MEIEKSKTANRPQSKGQSRHCHDTSTGRQRNRTDTVWSTPTIIVFQNIEELLVNLISYNFQVTTFSVS